MLGGYLALILLSFNPNDPSFNRAAKAEVTNLGGKIGALFADPLLQCIGVASLVPVAALIAYGIQLCSKGKLTWWWLRISMLFASLVSTATLASFVRAPESWYFSSLGGVIGSLVRKQLIMLVTYPMALMLTIATTLLTVFLALGISPSGWRRFITQVTLAIIFTCRFSYWCYRVVKLKYQAFRTPASKTSLPASFNIPVPSSSESGNTVKETKVTSPVNERQSLVEMPRLKPKKPVVAPTVKQAELPLATKSAEEEYLLPPLQYLANIPENRKQQTVSESSLTQNVRLLEKVLEDFGVQGAIVKVRPGPVVTLYELEPAAGVKSSRVIGLADDIARSMSAVSARIAVIPGRNVIGIELPNATREVVYLRELIETEAYHQEECKLPIALGKNIGGEAFIVDLSRMPHLLVAGTTGSGKSVAINAMILSFLYRLPPEQCRFIMIDPKMLELSVYDGIPHLLSPVVTEPKKAVVALKWAVKEMENRYRLMSTMGVRNILGYNKRIEEAIRKKEVLERTVQTGFDPESGKPIFEKVALEMKALPYIVVIVDEMADLMLVAGKEIESSIQRLAQMARAAGIHLIMATQRPSVDVITGVIKANFPTRISFQVTSRIDSRTILGEQGAEQLLGMGDMLYMAGGSRIIRVHAPFVGDHEVEQVVAFLKNQREPEYLTEITEEDDRESMATGNGEEGSDALYDEAVAIVVRDRKASTSYLQRCLKIGYNRAATLIERMEREGVISRANHVGKREILVPEGAYDEP